MAHKWLDQNIWFASVIHIDGSTSKFPVKNNYSKYPTPTGFLNGAVFTLKEARFMAFNQGGFGVKSIIVTRRDIRYCKKTKLYELL